MPVAGWQAVENTCKRFSNALNPRRQRLYS
jgi:hypothetical protein